MKTPIYLDYMATTPVDARVIHAMQQSMGIDGAFGNPDSNSHCFGWLAKEKVLGAKQQVLALINGSEHELIWTSGATEANNLALKGAAFANKHRGNHIITVKTEHKSVLDPCQFLEKEGFDVTYLDVDAQGLLNLNVLEQSIRQETMLISVMAVNNEIGVIQDLESIGKLAHEKGLLFHVDGVQAAGKIPIDVDRLQIDLLSLSAHKLYGPKGVGALFVRTKPRIRLKSQIHGGGQQGGLRAGTLPTHQIVGMGQAFEIAAHEMSDYIPHVRELTTYFWQELSKIPAVTLNGHPKERVVGNLNVCFKEVDAEAFMMEISELAVSNGSACNSIVTQSSYVLRALGLTERDGFCSIRFSLGRWTTDEEIDEALVAINRAVSRLRAMSPLWVATP